MSTNLSSEKGEVLLPSEFYQIIRRIYIFGAGQLQLQKNYSRFVNEGKNQ